MARATELLKNALRVIGVVGLIPLAMGAVGLTFLGIAALLVKALSASTGP
jgi:hypothetical protein